MPMESLNLKHVNLPSAWDSAELQRLSLVDGTTYEDMVSDIDEALSMASDALLSSFAGQLVSVTEEVAVEYGTGNTRGYERVTERGRGQGRRGDTTGHMLPLVGFDYDLYWTFLYLKNARRKQIDKQINELIGRTQDIFENQVYTRFFKMEEETGVYFGLGTSGVSVPFADGGGGTIPYTPPQNLERAAAFAASHDHFLRLDGITQANLETAVKHLWEHGYNGPFELIIPQADVSDWTNTTNVTGYVEKPDPLVIYGSDQSLSRPLDEWYIGGVKTEWGFCKMYANGRIPTGYWAVTKSFGPDDLMNPLMVRTEAGMPLGASLVGQQVGQYPLQDVSSLIFFGVGVGERREAAVLVEDDSSGDYATPTIT